MKKLTLLILALSLAFTLSACIEEDAGGDALGVPFDGSAETTTEPDAPSDDAPAGEDIPFVLPDREPPQAPEPGSGEIYYAVISVRDFGEITVRLYSAFAPLTVERFLENVGSGYYTGKSFHRIVNDFMIQAGSYDGQGGSDPAVEGIFTETHPEARHYYGAIALAANSLGFGSEQFYIVNSKNTGAFEYVLSMYQMEYNDIIENMEVYSEMFGMEVVVEALYEISDFINTPAHIRERYAEVGGAPFLDGGYTVFGYAVDGFDVIDAISAVEVVSNPFGEVSVPVEEVIIEWVVLIDSLD
jgi:cyclophilin family peptidyl-prolyl cis-trans isomerase